MENTLLIQVNNLKALSLLHELEKLHLIKVLKENLTPSSSKLSEKYKGVFTKEDAISFDNHIKALRDEWENS